MNVYSVVAAASLLVFVPEIWHPTQGHDLTQPMPCQGGAMSEAN